MSAQMATLTPVQHPQACLHPAGRIRVRPRSLPPLPGPLFTGLPASACPLTSSATVCPRVPTHPSDSPAS